MMQCCVQCVQLFIKIMLVDYACLRSANEKLLYILPMSDKFYVTTISTSSDPSQSSSFILLYSLLILTAVLQLRTGHGARMF